MIRLAVQCCRAVASRRLPRLRSRRVSTRRSGASCVEMAFVAPFIFLLFLGCVEFSRLLMIQQALTNAAREGCRMATLATTQDPAEVESRVRYYLRRNFTAYNDDTIVRVSLDPSTLTGISPGTPITTHVEVSFADVSWLPPSWANDVTIVGTATMKRE